MNKQIEDYIVKNFNELKIICRNITKNHSLQDDLLQDVVLQLYERKEINLRNFTDDSIKYFIVSVLRINWYSKTSPFFYRIRREILLYSELGSNIFEIPDNEQQRQFEKEMLLTVIENSYSELDWFHKSLMDMYMCMGSMNAVARKTKIPISSIRRYVKESKEQIQNEVKDKIKT